MGRFIRERAGDDPVPPVLCLTATAKPDVMAEIVDYFREELGIKLRVFDGGAQRTNLEFVVVPTSSEGKFAHIHQIIEDNLPANDRSGTIVYCATRRQAEEVAGYLQAKLESTERRLWGQSLKKPEGAPLNLGEWFSSRAATEQSRPYPRRL